MEKRSFIQLLRKHLKGQTNASENSFLEKYYDLFGNEPEVTARLKDEEKQTLKSEIFQAISEKVSEEGSRSEPAILRDMKKASVLRAAAAILILVLTAAVYLNIRKATKPLMGSDQWIQKKENHLILLPDGSTVILGWGSRFYRSAAFDSVNREVYLEGQAYFDIAHNPEKPFIVHTGKLETTVLGTAFTVEARPGEENITVSVARGKVKITRVKKVLGFITPGEQIVYNKKKDNAMRQSIDVESKLGWKDQDLFVDNVTVFEAARLLEERFRVKITVNDSVLAQNRFTTVFLKGEKLEQVMTSICEFNGAAYRFDKEKATLEIYRKSFE
jgi:ferric-dicitrate binding protein FerR (iron transport regulator)